MQWSCNDRNIPKEVPDRTVKFSERKAFNCAHGLPKYRKLYEKKMEQQFPYQY